MTGGSGGGVQVSADSLLLVATCCSCSSCDGLSVVAVVVVVDTAPRPTLASPDRWSPPPLLQSLPPPPSQLTASSPVHESRDRFANGRERLPGLCNPSHSATFKPHLNAHF